MGGSWIMMAENGKTVFVYGDGPICGEICLHFARNGAKVGFACRTDATASGLARSIESAGARALACVVQRPCAEELSRAVIAVAEEFCGIGRLVYARSASGAPGALLLDLDESDWDCAMDDAKAFFLLCKYALPYLINEKDSSVIIIDGNEADAQSLPGLASSKALEAAAGRMASELSEFGVSVSYERVADGEVARALRRQRKI